MHVRSRRQDRRANGSVKENTTARTTVSIGPAIWCCGQRWRAIHNSSGTPINGSRAPGPRQPQPRIVTIRLVGGSGNRPATPRSTSAGTAISCSGTRLSQANWARRRRSAWCANGCRTPIHTSSLPRCTCRRASPPTTHTTRFFTTITTTRMAAQRGCWTAQATPSGRHCMRDGGASNVSLPMTSTTRSGCKASMRIGQPGPVSRA